MGLFGGARAEPPPVTPPPSSMETVADLLKDLPRGNDPRAVAKGAATARFAQPDARDPYFRFDPDSRPTAVYLGIVGGSVATDPETGETYLQGGQAIGIDDDRHLMLVAGSRAGKGRAILLPNLLTYRGGVIATDPKGELATETALRRALPRDQGGLDQDVFILDPFGTVKGPAEAYRSAYNPIVAMRDDHLLEDAALLADSLVMANPNSRDPHWDESARTFIEGVIGIVRTSPAYEGQRTLSTVRRLINVGGDDAKEPSGSSWTALKIDFEMSELPWVRGAGVDFFSKPDRERESVHSTARRHTKFLDFDGIATVTGDDPDGPPVILENLRSTVPATIYLCLPAGHMDTCSRWLRLMVNQFLLTMERLGPMKRGTPPVLCVLDEFASLGHMRRLETAAAQIAGFGVRLWPVLQDLGQLEALYDKNYQTFMGNAGVLQFFGNSDLRTLEWISRRLGQTTVRRDERRPATAQRLQSGETDTVKTTEPSLMYLDEVARYFRRSDKKLRQLVFALDAEYPLILQRAFVDKHERFKALRITRRPAPRQETGDARS